MTNTVQALTGSPRKPADRSLSRAKAGVCVSVTASLFSGLLLLSAGVQSEGVRFDVPGEDNDFHRRIYAGASIGSSFLNPDTAGTDLRVSQSGGTAAQLRLGIDVHRRLAVELDTSVLGDASFEGSQDEVTYSVGSVSALIYGLNGVNLRSRRQGWNAYGRLGFGVVRKSSSIDSLEESKTVPILGAGVEYGFASGLGIRGEIVRVDSDAAYFGIGAIYRFGGARNSTYPVVADASSADEDRQHFQSEEDGGVRLAAAIPRHDPFADFEAPAVATKATTGSRWVPEIRADDSDRDGVLDEADRCPGTMSAVTVNSAGCGLFDSVLVDVSFNPGSVWLSEGARARLDELAADLLVFPEARIRVRAHTDSRGAADYNRELSARRAEAAVLYLRSVGIRERQLEPFGLGEARPIASNATRSGRRKNRRVEIVTMANLSDEELMSEEPEKLLPREAWAKVIVPTYRPEPGIAQKSKTQVAKEDVDMDANSSASDLANATRVQTDSMLRPLNIRTVKRKPVSAKVTTLPVAVATASQPMVDLDSLDSQLSDFDNNADRSGVDAVIQQLAVPTAEPEPTVVAAVPAAAPVPAATAFRVPQRLKPLPWRESAKGLSFVGIVEGLVFPEGSAALSSDARNSLTLLGFDLSANPGIRVAVMTHTDDRGDAEANLALSQLRAEKIVDHLVDNGVPSDRLVAEGYGGTLPLVQNVTEEDREVNRRVEVRVID